MMFMKQNEPPAGMMLFLLCLATACVCFALSGCKHPDMPPIDVSFWAGDSANGGVTRKQEGKTIPAIDPAFDQMGCLSYADIRKIYSTLLQCRDWGSQRTMSKREIKQFYQHNVDVIDHVSDDDND